MVEIPEIKDRDSLFAWLKEQPRAVSVWIASRAAARVLPVWWQAVLTADWVLTEDWVSKRDLTALPVLRSLLISSVAATVPTEEMRAYAARAARAAAENAARAAANLIADANTNAVFAARAAARAAVHLIADAANAKAAAANAARAAAIAHNAARGAAANAASWPTVRTDAVHALRGIPDTVPPLWPQKNNPLESLWQEVRDKATEDWTFWIAWYQSLLDGKPMLGDADKTKEMLTRIALIDPETWGKGPEVVNPVIDLIWKQYELLAEAERLKRQLSEATLQQASAEHRSHNQPPELVDQHADFARAVSDIETALDETIEELEKPTPEPARIREIAGKLLTAIGIVARYCGGLADIALQKAAEEAGTTGTKWAVRGAIAYYAAQTGPAEKLGKGLLEFADALAKVAPW